MSPRPSPRTNARLGLVCLLGLLTGTASALTPESARFRHVGLAEGLSQPSIKAMAQDRHGFLWFGTQTGLNRFDGMDMRVFSQDPDREGSLSHNSVNALLVDTGGRLWVGTDGGGLNRYDAERERFDVYRMRLDEPDSLPDDTVSALLQAGNGDIWIGTEAGLAHWQSDGDRLRRILPGDGAGAGLRIRALAWADRGALWVGSTGGLQRYDPPSGAWQTAPLPAALATVATRPVRSLLAAADGSLWIGSDVGLVWWHPATGDSRHWRHDPDDPDSLGNDVVSSLLRDREGRLWVGHEAGVDALVDELGAPRFMRFRNQRRAPQTLGNGRVTSLMQDRAGGLWFGTWSSGASMLSPFGRRILSFDPDIPATAALGEPEIPALVAQEPSTLWLGGRGGLFAFDVESRRLTSFPGVGTVRIYALARDEEHLYLGTEQGLLRYTPADAAVLRAPVAGAAPPQINALFRDGDLLWVGTRDPGLLLVDRESLEVRQRFPGDGLVRFITPFDEERMLVGTAHGLFWHDRQSGQPLYRHLADPTRPGALRSSTVSSFLRARDGQMWLATASGGLHRMELADPDDPATARFEVFSRGAGPMADTISGLLEDDEGRLWASSGRGVVRFEPRSARFTTYLPVDGASASGYYANVKAQFASGLMAFGSPEGFTLVDPGAAVDLPAPPRPLLTELLLDNRPLAAVANSVLEKPLHLADELRLPSGLARTLGLRFASPDTLSARQLQYTYRLEGFDSDWIETHAGARQVSYTNLPAGRYRFRVAALNQDGLRSAEDAVLDIVLLPPWWQTIWAQMLIALGVLLAVYAAHHRRVARIAAQREVLQRKVEDRTAELRDSNRALSGALDDLRRTQRSLVEQEKMASLGGLVAGVAHEINTPVGIALTSASHVNELTHTLVSKLGAGKLTQSDFHHFRDTVNEGMRLIMSSLDRAHTLVASFKQVAVDQSSEQRRSFELSTFLDEVGHSLQPSYRQTEHRLHVRCPENITLDTYPGALFQIITNLVNNSLIHGFVDGRVGRMELEVESSGPEVILRYRDNGVGMPAEVAARAFDPFFTTRRGSGGSGLGLHIVYNIATQLLGGRIALRPLPEGTQFDLHIPRRAPERAAAQGE